MPDNKPNYRIPSIISAPNGDVLAIVEKRNHGIGDVGNTDIVMRASSDLGKTWSPIRVILDDGPNTCTDITPCIDWDTNRLYVFFLRDKKRFCYIYSDNSGKTWSKIVDIHESVTKPEWETVGLKSGAVVDSSTDRETGKTSKAAEWRRNWVQRYGIGPGSAGIQLKQGKHKGRLIIPARHLEQEGRSHVTYSHVFYSDDHGKTWQIGPHKIIKFGNESRLIELANGDLMINARSAHSPSGPDDHRRLVAVSHDGGDTWPVVYKDEGLVSLRCHASILAYRHPDSPHNGLVLFANPASPYHQEEHPYGRYNVTVRWSRDNGATWSAGRPIYPHTSSYTDLTVLSDGSIGMIYERGKKGSVKYWDSLQFVRFNLEWLLAPPHTAWNP
jgi:sialidase-1